MMTGGATLLLYGVFVLLMQLANRSVTRELHDRRRVNARRRCCC